MKKITKLFTAALLSLVIFTGAAQAKERVELVYVEWARAVAITHVAGVLLEEMGYDVKTSSVANAAMWASVAEGDSDALLCAWLPVTHADLYTKYKEKIVDLGPNYVDAKLGFVVPAYVTINSVREMGANIDKFRGKIIGIDPGAGMSKAAEEAIAKNTAGIGKFEYVSGSDAIMVASLSNAIKRKEWIVVPGWQPHWMFGEWDLKILDDPDKIFGGAETINTVVRKGLDKDMPEVYTFLSKFDWKQIDLSSALVDNKNGMDPKKSAEKFVKANRAKIDELLKAVK
ncbi:glycine betaine ABC transporter substrate-binding protein [Geovibrio thiophilus]|uniref:Glycine betaine ABC transporter substrate-binding protein n=1 Tax=Geovibrio thiophilus TaxID=139438 RepID=A0A3R5Y599_9BACT|nr:glycine betaine ABC transporter substrate-binding protein [Geovibrio thiophilus]QAR32048.1 glycine betaine ABC transporter substrate-binding protein [Geovibrio thiophilus]